MYGFEGATDAGIPIPPPPPPPADEETFSPRYVYLLNRLRSRQITMEEATELFAVQQSMLARAKAASMSARPPQPAIPGATAASNRSPSAAPRAYLDDDRIWEGLLLAGPAAGLFAALIKKLKEGAPPSRDPPSSGPTGVPRE